MEVPLFWVVCSVITRATLWAKIRVSATEMLLVDKALRAASSPAAALSATIVAIFAAIELVRLSRSFASLFLRAGGRKAPRR